MVMFRTYILSYELTGTGSNSIEVLVAEFGNAQTHPDFSEM